jgi:preprotein translocase subunit YajC
MEGAGSFLFLGLLFAAMYFMLIRPQSKRQKAIAELQRSLDVGADVITIGGIHGHVVAATDAYVDLEVSGDGTVMRFKRSAVADIVSDEVASGDDGDDDE